MTTTKHYLYGTLEENTLSMELELKEIKLGKIVEDVLVVSVKGVSLCFFHSLQLSGTKIEVIDIVVT